MTLKLPIGTTRTVSKTFDQTDVDAFAGLSGDHNPLHLDPEYAEYTRFGERIMHGALTSSLISAALAALPGCVVFLEQNVRFTRAATVGNTLEAEVVVADVLDGGVHEVDVTVRDALGETYVTGIARVLIDSMNEYADALMEDGVERMESADGFHAEGDESDEVSA